MAAAKKCFENSSLLCVPTQNLSPPSEGKQINVLHLVQRPLGWISCP